MVSKETDPKTTDQNDVVTLVTDPFGIPNLDLENAASEFLPDTEQSTEIGAEIETDDLGSDESDLDMSAVAIQPDEQDLRTLQNLTIAISAETERSMAELGQTLSAEAPSAPIAAMDGAPQTLENEAAEIIEAIAPDTRTPGDATDEPTAVPMELTDLDLVEMQSCIEAILFMADKPLSAEKLQAALGEGVEFQLVQEALTAIVDRYQGPQHGFECAAVAGGYQFRTKPGRAGLAKRLAKVQTQKLSSGAMETLAVVAYRQPVMKEDIDQVRGVDSSYFIRALLDRKLIRISGRSEMPGRPMLYGTTQEFLELFGLKELSDMPSLREIEQMIPASQVGSSDESDPRVKQMRKLVGEMNQDDSTKLTYNPEEDELFLTNIRERVKAVSTTTPYLEEQQRLAKEAELAAAAPAPDALREVASESDKTH